METRALFSSLSCGVELSRRYAGWSSPCGVEWGGPRPHHRNHRRRRSRRERRLEAIEVAMASAVVGSKLELFAIMPIEKR